MEAFYPVIFLFAENKEFSLGQDKQASQSF